MATAHRFEDLIAWQRAEELKEEIFHLTIRHHVARDWRFCEQIQESARSATANIAEGFGRYDPKPNAYFVSIAKASLHETQNHVHDGFKREYFDAVERDHLLQLTKRAIVATGRYLRYLKSCKRAPDGRPHQPPTDRNRNDNLHNQNLHNQNLPNQSPKNENLQNENLQNENPQNQNQQNQNPQNENLKNQQNKNLKNPRNP